MPDTELVLELLDQIQGEMRAGFTGVHLRQDIANGRTNQNERDIAKLAERSAQNVCTVHGERLTAVETKLTDLRADRRKAIAITSGAVAGVLVIIEGIWQWAQKHPF